MPTWYHLFRDGHQYGPYPAEQLLRLYHSRQLLPGDLFLQTGRQNWLALQQALPSWQSQSAAAGHTQQGIQQLSQPFPVYATPAPAYQQPSASGSPPPRRKKRGCLVFCLVFLIITAGLLTAFTLTRTSDVVQTSRSQQLASERIDDSGGTLAVNNPGHPLDGLRLTIPSDAYAKTRRFSISARPVEQHKLGQDVEILTPLISIDNGHAFAAEPMLLKIPIRLEQGQFAMGFYYDRRTGALEGIPFSELTDTHITLVTHHFSDVLVAATDLQTLTDLAVDSGFRPGLDDWQFVNRGSSISPGGHCAGQALTAMFYFTEIHLGQNEPRLYGRFDNNRYGVKTASFQEDDSWGYRFASVAQEEMAWGTRSLNLQDTIGHASDLYSLAAFAFAMQLTGEPQMVYIAGSVTRSSRPYRFAHAVIAYRIEDGRVYVADPNYPGQGDRFIAFDASGSFQPYGSGENADDIEAHGVLPFTIVRYLAKTSLVDYSRLHEQYRSMLRGDIGAHLFPDYQVEYLQSVNERTGRETWVELPDDLELTADDTEKAGPNMRGEIQIRVTNPSDKTLRFGFYHGLSPVSDAPTTWEIHSGRDRKITLTLSEGVTHQGIKIEHIVNRRYRYTDFVRVQIVYEQQAELELHAAYQVLSEQTYTYTARVRDEPDQPRYSWDFGDGQPPVITDKPTVTYTYAEGGDYLLTLTLKDSQTGALLAMSDAPVKALDLFGSWQLDYTIEEAGMIDRLLTQFVKVIGRFIAEILATEIDEADLEVTLKGTVISCEMTVLQPARPDGPIRIRLQQLASSTDFVEPTAETWTGELTMKDDQVIISITAEGQPTGITFRGTLSQGLLYGEMDAVVFSGSFQATR